MELGGEGNVLGLDHRARLVVRLGSVSAKVVSIFEDLPRVAVRELEQQVDDVWVVLVHAAAREQPVQRGRVQRDHLLLREVHSQAIFRTGTRG